MTYFPYILDKFNKDFFKFMENRPYYLDDWLRDYFPYREKFDAYEDYAEGDTDEKWDNFDYDVEFKKAEQRAIQKYKNIYPGAKIEHFFDEDDETFAIFVRKTFENKIQDLAEDTLERIKEFSEKFNKYNDEHLLIKAVKDTSLDYFEEKTNKYDLPDYTRKKYSMRSKLI